MQQFTLNKSALLLRFLLIIHGLAAIASLANALPWLYKFIILVAVAYSLFISVRRYHSQFQPYCIKHTDSSVWQLATSYQDFQTIQILSSSVTTVWLTALHFRLETGKRQSLVIFHDALSEKDYRALIVALKLSASNQNTDKF